MSYTADDARLGQSSYLSHVIYGAAKSLSYALIGAISGLLGAIIAFTPMLRGVAGTMAGIFLVLFGLNMLNLFPVLRKIPLKLPNGITRFLGQHSRSRNRPLNWPFEWSDDRLRPFASHVCHGGGNRQRD